MKIAVFSDIHGNSYALDAVLTQIEREVVDAAYCLGDLVNGGGGGDAIITALQNAGIQCISGNHDAFLVDPSSSEFPPRIQVYALALLEWAKQNLSENSWDYLQKLPDFIGVELSAAVKVHLCHATPISKWVLAPLHLDAGESLLKEHFGGVDANVICHGHAHEGTGIRPYQNHLIVNVASVGMNPIVNTTGYAGYTIIESCASNFVIRQEKIIYDWQAARKQAEERGVPVLNQ